MCATARGLWCLLMCAAVACMGIVVQAQDGSTKATLESTTPRITTTGNVPFTVNETSHVHDTTPETEETCDGPLCVRKCCSAGTHLDENFDCAPHEEGLWSPTETFLKDRKDVDGSKLQVLYGFPSGCSEEDFIKFEDSFQLLQDGKMLAPSHNLTEPVSRYCLGNLHGYEGKRGVFCRTQLEESRISESKSNNNTRMITRTSRSTSASNSNISSSTNSITTSTTTNLEEENLTPGSQEYVDSNDNISVFEPSPEPIETCDGTLCVRKCCPAGEHLTEEFECAQHEVGLWSPSTTFLKDRKDVEGSKLQILHGFPPGCSGEDYLELEDSFQLLQSGKMSAPSHNWSEPASRYCLENLHGYEGELGIFCTSPLEDYVTVDDGMGEHCEFHGIVYPVLMSFSSFFLILTLAVYAGVPKLRLRTYGRCLISLVTALLIFYIMQIANFIMIVEKTHYCITLAFFMHWNGLAIFFWLNVMAFELWRTVRSRTPVTNDMKTFMKYSAYAWGVPFLIAIITVIIDHLPESYENLLRPKLAGNTCFLEGYKERWAYLYWVIIVITLVNLSFFIDICYSIYKAKQNATKKRGNSFWIFLKMFLIIGISWVLELFSSRECLWIIGDLPNLLQGVFIFLATVCNKPVLKEVLDYLSPRFRGLSVFWQDVRQKITSTAAAPSSNVTGTRATGLVGNSSVGDGLSHSNNGQDNFAAISLDNLSPKK